MALVALEGLDPWHVNRRDATSNLASPESSQTSPYWESVEGIYSRLCSAYGNMAGWEVGGRSGAGKMLAFQSVRVLASARLANYGRRGAEALRSFGLTAPLHSPFWTTQYTFALALAMGDPFLPLLIGCRAMKAERR
jgi:hypothetical protein